MGNICGILWFFVGLDFDFFGVFCFVFKSCSVILVYFLTLEAAGRMTGLPGQPLGRCTGLLPGHMELLPWARQCCHGQAARGHRARPWQTGPEPSVSQTSAPTLPGLGTNTRLLSHRESPDAQSTLIHPPARTG